MEMLNLKSCYFYCISCQPQQIQRDRVGEIQSRTFYAVLVKNTGNHLIIKMLNFNTAISLLDLDILAAVNLFV